MNESGGACSFGEPFVTDMASTAHARMSVCVVGVRWLHSA
jgi:hypothetical protein